MCTAFLGFPTLQLRTVLAIGTHRSADMPPHVEWHESAHPIPDERSVSAASRALDVASHVGDDECLVLLLSGGASAVMAAPIAALSLAQKQRVVRDMMHGGADIAALNTVRKHLSTVKGGRLAAACKGTTVTLAISDVVGDDLSVIGSGPGIADSSTWHDVRQAVRRYAPHADDILAVADDGVRGVIDETPKPGVGALARAHAFVVASRRHALDAAARAAVALGYKTVALVDDITGEARDAAHAWLPAATRAARAASATCVVSAGETTVRVVGRGRGGRNQEFALALVDAVAAYADDLVIASVGTDGIDGPTDAAGALVDRTTGARARELDLDAHAFLAHNNAYEFFANLGDLVHLGRTDTNVGDVQVLLRRAVLIK